MSEDDEKADEESLETEEAFDVESETETEVEPEEERSQSEEEVEESEEESKEEDKEPEEETEAEGEEEEEEEEEEEDELELPTPPEPTELREELRRTYHDELTPNEERRRNPQRDNVMRVPTAVAEATAEKLEPYLWDHWEETLEEEQIDKSDFQQIAILPQSDALRWLKDEVSWEYYAKAVARKVKRRDELLG